MVKARRSEPFEHSLEANIDSTTKLCHTPTSMLQRGCLTALVWFLREWTFASDGALKYSNCGWGAAGHKRGGAMDTSARVGSRPRRLTT